jgi:tripartite-type tricarboxylate transporter receptor subunit TctC
MRRQIRTSIQAVLMVAALAASLALGSAVAAAEFPEKPIQVLVGWPAGSLNDMIDRAVAQVLQRSLKQPVVVQNVPGGGGALVLGRVKSEKPDGYTIFQTGSPMYSRTPHLRVVPFDPLKDFAYLAQDSWFQFFIEDRADSPWKNFDEMIAYVKQHPRQVKYATAGVGTSQHLMMEHLAAREGLQWIHVPFTGGNESVAALLGGHVQVYAGNLGGELDHIKSGRLRVILALNATRLTLFPDAPTILEKGYEYSVKSGRTWAVPAATPKAVQKTLESALLQAFKDPVVVESMRKWDMLVESLDGERLTKTIHDDYAMNANLMKKLGFGIYKKN